MSAPVPSPVPNYVFHQDLDHFLTVLLGLDLTSPDNFYVEMFCYQAITTFYQLKVLCPQNLRN